MPIVIQPLDDDATAAGEPLDAWIEITARNNAKALLETNYCSSPFDVSNQLQWNTSTGAPINQSALFTYKRMIFAIVPLRLEVGTFRVKVKIYATLLVQPGDATPAPVNVIAWLRRSERATVPLDDLAADAGILLTPGTDPQVFELDISFPTRRLEEVADLVLAVSSGAGEEYADVDVTKAFRAGSRSFDRDTPVQFNVISANRMPPGTVILAEDFASTAGFPDTWCEPANAPDASFTTDAYDTVLLYDEIPQSRARNILLTLYYLTGFSPRSIAVELEREVGDLITQTAAHRARIEVQGSVHGELDGLVALTQTRPHHVLVRPRGDTIGGDEELEMRSWRCAYGSVIPAISRNVIQPILLDDLILPDRDFGELEIQLRLLVVGNTEAELEDCRFFAGLSANFRPTDVPTITTGFVGAATLRRYAISGEGFGWPRERVLRDLRRHFVRYAAGVSTSERQWAVSAADRPTTRAGAEERKTQQGWRAGLLDMDALGLVQTVVLRLPITAQLKAEWLRIEIDPRSTLTPDDRLWTRWPDTLVACVGASVIWDGRQIG